jgi:hypothetical protein
VTCARANVPDAYIMRGCIQGHSMLQPGLYSSMWGVQAAEFNARRGTRCSMLGGSRARHAQWSPHSASIFARLFSTKADPATDHNRAPVKLSGPLHLHSSPHAHPNLSACFMIFSRTTTLLCSTGHYEFN